MGRLLEGPYGGFEEDGRVYAITEWRTPRPWINVLSNGRWGCTISQTGAGYAWHTHAMFNRMTRWQQDLLTDRDGIFWYLRDDESGQVWSVTPRPAGAALDRYLCRHGLGWSGFETAAHGVASSLTLSVPSDVDGTVYDLVLDNEGGARRRLSVFVYLEPHAGEAPGWHREFHDCFISVDRDEATGGLQATSRLWTVAAPGIEGWNRDWPWTLVLMGTPAPIGFEGSREAFLGTYGDLAAPAGLGRPRLEGQLGSGFSPCMVLQFRVELPAGGRAQVAALAGAFHHDDKERAMPRFVAALEQAPELAAKTRAGWEDLCRRTWVETPEPAIDVMVNWWLPYQAVACRLFGRSAYYQTGGAFGFRDQLQDSLVWLAMDPAQTRTRLLIHAGQQFASGRVRHWWHPLTDEGPDTGCSDDLLWLPFVLAEYLNETGDGTVLQEQVPFLDAPPASLYEHVRRSVDHALERCSARGLPLIGSCDWNDGMNAVGAAGRGESVWLAMFLLSFLPRMADLATHMGDDQAKARWVAGAGRLRAAVWEHGWEGDRFIRAFTDEGTPLGSASCSRGSLYLNPQTWAIMAGVVAGDDARSLMDLVVRELGRPYGVLLLHPPYDRPDASIGYLTRYAPGSRENGGVYTHAATWAIAAAAMADRGPCAYDLLRSLLPPLRSAADALTYGGEPYVTPGNVQGPGTPHEGRGAWTWYTGSAAWLRRVALERVLGVRVEGERLVVDPRVPDDWAGFTVGRFFRGETIVTTLRRVDGALQVVDTDVSHRC